MQDEYFPTAASAINHSRRASASRALGISGRTGSRIEALHRSLRWRSFRSVIASSFAWDFFSSEASSWITLFVRQFDPERKRMQSSLLQRPRAPLGNKSLSPEGQGEPFPSLLRPANEQHPQDGFAATPCGRANF